MGQGMADNLLKNGADLVVYTRDPRQGRRHGGQGRRRRRLARRSGPALRHRDGVPRQRGHHPGHLHGAGRAVPKTPGLEQCLSTTARLTYPLRGNAPPRLRKPSTFPRRAHQRRPSQSGRRHHVDYGRWRRCGFRNGKTFLRNDGREREAHGTDRGRYSHEVDQPDSRRHPLCGGGEAFALANAAGVNIAEAVDILSVSWGQSTMLERNGPLLRRGTSTTPPRRLGIWSRTSASSKNWPTI